MLTPLCLRGCAGDFRTPLCWGFPYTVAFGAHDNVKGWCVLPRSHLRRKSSGRLGWLPSLQLVPG